MKVLTIPNLSPVYFFYALQKTFNEEWTCSEINTALEDIVGTPCFPANTDKSPTEDQSIDSYDDEDIDNDIDNVCGDNCNDDWNEANDVEVQLYEIPARTKMNGRQRSFTWKRKN